jgi:hypothetical protein
MTDRPTTIDDWDAHRQADRERVKRLAVEMKTVAPEPELEELELTDAPA